MKTYRVTKEYAVRCIFDITAENDDEAWELANSYDPEFEMTGIYDEEGEPLLELGSEVDVEGEKIIEIWDPEEERIL